MATAHHPNATEQPSSVGIHWFHGTARHGLVTDRVQNRRIQVVERDGALVNTDPDTGVVIESELRGWFVREEDMGR